MKKAIIALIAVALAALSVLAFLGFFGENGWADLFRDETVVSDSTTADASPVTPDEDIGNTDTTVTEPTSAAEVTTTAAAETTTTEQTLASTTTTANGEAAVTITGSNVNVRKGPGTEYGRVCSANKGETYHAISYAKSESGSVWYRIKINGTTGYVYSGYATVSGDLKEESFTAAATTQTAATTVGQATTTANSPSQTTTASQNPVTTTTTPTASEPSGNWAKGTSGEVISELRSYAAGVGYQWLSTLNADNSTWDSVTGAWTYGFLSKSEFIAKMKDKISYQKSIDPMCEYINICVIERDGDDYRIMCYFG